MNEYEKEYELAVNFANGAGAYGSNYQEKTWTCDKCNRKYHVNVKVCNCKYLTEQ